MKLATKILIAANRIFDRIVFYASILGTVTLVSVMLTMMTDVFGRWMKIPVYGIYEFNALLIGMTVYMSITYTQAMKKHITISIIASRLTARGKAVLNLVLLLPCFALFGHLSVVYGQLAYKSFITNEKTTGIIEFPLYPLKTVMFLGITMLSIQLAIDVIRAALFIHSNRFPKPTIAIALGESEEGAT